jgi:hypothetical protein
VHVCSSRGCPKKCTFCSIVVASPNYRVRSVDSLMAEIEALRRDRGFGHVYFVDANFAVSVKRTLDFSRRLAAWDPAVTWSGTASADLILRHAEVMPEIAGRNCIQLEIGIESGSRSQLARYNKRTDVDQNGAALAMLARCGISVGLDFIMFDPESSFAELRENLDFLRDNDLFGTSPPACLFNAMRLYGGTPARQRYLGLLGLADDHLDHIECRYLDAGVAAMAEIVHAYFIDYQQILTDTLVLLQARWREAEAEMPARPLYRQQIAALIVECRHEPYQFFEDVLALAESGAIPPGLELGDLPDQDWHRRLTGLVRRASELIEAPPSAYAGAADEPIWVERHGTLYAIPPEGLPLRLSREASQVWREISAGRRQAGAEAGAD